MLTILCGLPQSGKTQLCLDQITASLAPGQPLLYIVPEQFSLQSEKALTERLGAFARVQVLSFQRLAYMVFAKAGAVPGVHLDDTGKALLLKKILLDLTDELPFYARGTDKPGFVAQLAQTVTELRQYRMDPDELLERAGRFPEDSPLRRKLGDIHRIFAAYTAYCAQKYISADETLDILAARLPQTNFLRGARIWIDGFHGFTPQEYRVIGILLRQGDVSLTLTGDFSAIPAPLREQDFFFETRRTAVKLARLAEDSGVPCRVVPVARAAGRPALAHFTKHFPGQTVTAFPDTQRAIAIHPAAEPNEEVEDAALTVLRLVRDENYRYRDIALLCGDEGYYPLAEQTFRRHGIPLFSDRKGDILAFPLAEALRAAVDVAVSNYSYESVFRLLKTNLTGIPPEEIDLLENYVLAYGIKGYRWRLERWTMGAAGYDLDRVNAVKDRVLELLAPFAGSGSGLRGDSRRTARELTAGLYRMLAAMEADKRLAAWVEWLKTEGEFNLARQYGQLWGKIAAMAEQLAEILGGETVTVKAYGKILEAGLSSIEMGVIPPTLDQVTLGDAERSRLPAIRVLLVLGANEGHMPRPAAPLGLFTDDERRLFAGAGAELGPDGRRKTAELQFLLYSAFCKPSERLIFSYASGDLRGKTRQPAGWLAKVRRMFLPPADQAAPLPSPVALLDRYGSFLREGDENTSPAAYRLLAEVAGFPPVLARMETLAADRRPENLSPAAVRERYGEILSTTISRLEAYRRCPFQYFMSYNLLARERRLYEPKAVDYGNLFHDVLEGFDKTLKEQDIPWRDLSKEAIPPLVESVLAKAAPQLGEEVLYSSPRLSYMLGRVRGIAERSLEALVSHVKAGMFTPAGAEVNFDTPLTQIVIELPGDRKMTLRGRIDRVDFCDLSGGRYVRVLDYKSGMTSFDLDDIYFGMQLQLLIYLDALLANGRRLFGGVSGGLKPGGVFYFHLQDPLVEGENSPETLERLLLAEFRMDGVAAADPQVLRAMDSEMIGRSQIIPAGFKADGGLYANSSVLDEVGFQVLRGAVRDQARDIGQSILAGEIPAYPYKKGQRTGCDYCQFAAACGFGTRDGDRYHVVRKRG